MDSSEFQSRNAVWYAYAQVMRPLWYISICVYTYVYIYVYISLGNV